MNFAKDLSLRHLKAARCIADHSNISRAAKSLNKTQSALTKSLNQLETLVGSRLFDRSSKGMSLTAYGEVFIRRIREAENQFTQASVKHSKLVARSSELPLNPVFSLDISRKRLDAFLELFDTGNVAIAAAHLGLTRAAVYSSIRELEKYLELQLFEYGSLRVIPSDYCEILATHVKLAFSLIQTGLDEVASVDGITRGHVVIGALPYSRTMLIPRTIQRVLEHHRYLQISTREGPYDVLETSLRNGDIDLIIGATRHDDKSAGLQIVDLFKDKLAIIARATHPAARAKSVTLEQLKNYGWILPPKSTPARHLFDTSLGNQGISFTQSVVETSSLSTIRGLLLESDRIALLSTHQIYYDEQAGLLVTLPIELKNTFRPIGITTRANTTPSPAAKLVTDIVTQVAKEAL